MAEESTQETARRVHEVLTARGWLLDERDRDQAGYPRDHRIQWSYPLSYGGEAVNPIEDVSPEVAACLFNLDANDDIADIVLVEAGNVDGCPQHAKTARHIGRDSTEQLITELDRVETRARPLDARDLIECRFFGPCGQPAGR